MTVLNSKSYPKRRFFDVCGVFGVRGPEREHGVWEWRGRRDLRLSEDSGLAPPSRSVPSSRPHDRVDWRVPGGTGRTRGSRVVGHPFYDKASDVRSRDRIGHRLGTGLRTDSESCPGSSNDLIPLHGHGSGVPRQEPDIFTDIGTSQSCVW